MNILSLCSGVGGMDLGFEQAGHTIVAQCEIDPIARSVLRRHWPDVPCHDDICTLDGTAYRGIDIVIGGTPCQDLSIAGKRSGLDGQRSGLWWEMLRIIREARPTLVVWENVEGSLSSNRGRDFGVILDSLAEVGALDISYRVLDAQFFGVAQRRRRVFVVADFGAERAGEILLEPEGSGGHPAAGSTARQEVAGSAGRSPARDGWQPSVAATLGAHKKGQRYDLDNDTYVVPSVAASAITTKEGRRGPRGDGSDNLVVAAVDFVNVTSKANRTRVAYGSPTEQKGGAGWGVRRLTPL